jgi:uncharacterized membrane protein YfbV (UPF0208 family)
MNDLNAAVVGVLLTLLLTAVGYWIKSSQEHEKWKRERKYEAYMLFFYEISRTMDWTSEVMTGGTTASVNTRDESEGIWRMSAAVNMHLPEKLVEDFRQINKFLGDLSQWGRNTMSGVRDPARYDELHSENKEALDRLTEAMKKDLKVV